MFDFFSRSSVPYPNAVARPDDDDDCRAWEKVLIIDEATRRGPGFGNARRGPTWPLAVRASRPPALRLTDQYLCTARRGTGATPVQPPERRAGRATVQVAARPARVYPRFCRPTAPHRLCGARVDFRALVYPCPGRSVSIWHCAPPWRAPKKRGIALSGRVSPRERRGGEILRVARVRLGRVGADEAGNERPELAIGSGPGRR